MAPPVARTQYLCVSPGANMGAWSTTCKHAKACYTRLPIQFVVPITICALLPAAFSAVKSALQPGSRLTCQLADECPATATPAYLGRQAPSRAARRL